MAVATPARTRVAPTAEAAARPARRGATAALLLIVLLLGVAFYAAFANGAVDEPYEMRVQIALTIGALFVCASWLTGGALRPAPSRTAWWAVICFTGFAAWSGLSLLWSVAPDLSWAELNRGGAYALAVAIALFAGATATRAIERVAVGYLIVAVIVALYAIGGKVLPGFHIDPIFDLNHTAIFSRLRGPLGYWNALAIVVVLAVPIALRMITDVTRTTRGRLAALAALYLLFIVSALTYSRGGLLAMLVAVGVATWFGSGRLRGLVAFSLAVVAALPPVLCAFLLPAISANAVPLGLRIHDGKILLAVLVASMAVMLAVAWVLLRLEPRVRWTRERTRRLTRGLRWVTGAFLLIAVIGMAQSQRGLPGTISHQVSSFTKAHKDPLSDPSHLVSTNSGNRWVWWQEALGAWSDRPLQGYGAGSFPVTHLMYRQNELPVRQPHNVPIQFLAETGFVGTMLWIGAMVLLLLAAANRVRGLPAGRQRDMGAALLGAGIAWTLHTVYDWDWDIPGATLPALIMLGVLAAKPVRDRGHGHGLAAAFEVPSAARARPAMLSAAALLLCAFAMSSLLPSWSHGKAIDALGKAGHKNATKAELQDAAAEADLAARLNPLAVDPLFAAQTIAERRGRNAEARQYLLDAVERQPQNRVAWFRLALLAAEAHNPAGFLRAAHKALELDPMAGVVRGLAVRAEGFAAPPNESASATGTPLPAIVSAAP
jgi:O-Antigen ligase